MYLALGVTVQYVAYCLGYTFNPDNVQAITDPRLPALYNISASQTLPYNEAPASGFLTYSFVTASTGSQYFIVSGVFAYPGSGSASYGASILDLSAPQGHSYTTLTTITDEELQSFNFSRPGYQFSGLPPSNLDIALYSNTNNVSFNLTTHATSRALYYAGAGAYTYVSGPAYNWALPACKTSGSISLPRTPRVTVTVNASASITWYDRWWGAPDLRNSNSTFFALYFGNSDLVLSAYAIDSIGSGPGPGLGRHITRFGNLHHRGGFSLTLVPINLTVSAAGDALWTSPRTGRVYAVKWELAIEERGVIEIQSMPVDQEFVSQEGIPVPYIGFVNFTGVFDGLAVRGFGVVARRFPAPV